MELKKDFVHLRISLSTMNSVDGFKPTAQWQKSIDGQQDQLTLFEI